MHYMLLYFFGRNHAPLHFIVNYLLFGLILTPHSFEFLPQVPLLGHPSQLDMTLPSYFKYSRYDSPILGCLTPKLSAIVHPIDANDLLKGIFP